MTGATEWSQNTKRAVAIGLVLLGLLILYVSRPILSTLVLAGILAFVLNPIVKFFMQHLRAPRWLAVILSFLLLLITVILVPLLFTPAIVNAVQDIDIDFVTLWHDVSTWLQRSLIDIRSVKILQFKVDLSSMVDPALEMLGGVVPEAMTPSLTQVFESIPSVFQLATGVASTVVSTVFAGVLAISVTLIFGIYISLDLPNIHRSLLDLIPMPHRIEYAILLNEIRDVWNAYLRGQLLLMIIVGAMTTVGNVALGMPGAALLGLVAALFEVLPNVGPVLAAIPAVLVALLQGSSVLPVSNLVFALVIIGFYIVVQQVENNLIVPRVIGDAIEVHPILVMAGVILGATIGGIFGALVAAPVLATARVLGQFVYRKMLGQPPYPLFMPSTTTGAPEEVATSEETLSPAPAGDQATEAAAGAPGATSSRRRRRKKADPVEGQS